LLRYLFTNNDHQCRVRELLYYCRAKRGWKTTFAENLFPVEAELSIVKTPSAKTTRDLQDLVNKEIFTKTEKLKSTRYELNFAPFPNASFR